MQIRSVSKEKVEALKAPLAIDHKENACKTSAATEW